MNDKEIHLKFAPGKEILVLPSEKVQGDATVLAKVIKRSYSLREGKNC